MKNSSKNDIIMTQKVKRLKKLEQNSKNTSYIDLRTILEQFGYELVRITGSHHIFKKETRYINFPVHNKKVKSIYIKQILKQLKKYERL